MGAEDMDVTPDFQTPASDAGANNRARRPSRRPALDGIAGALRRFGRAVARFVPRSRREPAGPVDRFVARDDVRVFVHSFERRWSARAEGRRDGVMALPRAEDAAVRPAYLQTLLNEAQEAIGTMLAAAHRAAGQIAQDLAARREDLMPRLQGALAEFRDVRLPRCELNHTSELFEAHRTHQEALRMFNEFRERNGLGGEKPQPSRGLLRYAIVVAIVLIAEAALNGYAMQDASPTGLRGAAVWGAAVGATNIILGLVCGHFARWRHHRRLVPRLAGWAVTLLSAALCLALQSLVATWRYAASGDVDLADALHSAGVTFWLHPWMWMGDLQCWMLALLGALSFGAAFLEAEGLTGHRYPGFAEVWKRERAAEQQELDVLGSMEDETRAAMEEAEARLDAIVDEAGSDLDAYDAGAGELRRLARAVQERLASVSLEVNRLRQDYVEANRRTRGDAPLPPYLLRVTSLNLAMPNFGQGDAPTEAWLQARQTEAAKWAADAKSAMVRLRVKATAALRDRLTALDGRPATGEPAPPLEPLDPDANGGLTFHQS